MFKVVLDGKEVQLYQSFRINKSLGNFVDSFNITLSNPGGLYSKAIPVGCYLNIYVENVEIFRGICESKKSSYDTVGSTLTFSGREEFMLITEDDISPLHKDYKKIADNVIIKDVCSGYGWDFELDTPKVIKEYEISNSGTRKGQVVSDVVSRNNFYIYKVGNTIYKKSLPKEGDYTERKRPQFTLSTQGGGFVDFNNRLLNVSIDEDISGCKSKLRGHTYGTGTAKPKIKESIDNKHLLNGSYPQRLRNLNAETRTAPVIDRGVSLSVPVKSSSELKLALENKKVEADIQIGVTVTVAEFLDLQILDTVEIFIQDEDIKQYMYIKEMSYNFDGNNKFHTSFTFTPIIPVENT